MSLRRAVASAQTRFATGRRAFTQARFTRGPGKASCLAAAGAFAAVGTALYYQGGADLAFAFGEMTGVGSKIKPHPSHLKLPCEMAKLTFAPEVPPPITRDHSVLLRVDLVFDNITVNVTRRNKYEMWSINGHVPGPFIRAREGDVLEVNVQNDETSGMPHNIDFHACDGPGGGAPLLLADQGRSRSAHFQLTHPGLFVYHCAAGPIPMHIANGMYGLILVEPKGGMPKVDKEFYIFQSEFYLDLANMDPQTGVTPLDYQKGLLEEADACVFNGREGSMTDKEVLKCKVGDTVRLFVGNGGPNLISSFHVIGTTFERLYREGDILSPPARNVQTTLVAPGGATVAEFKTEVPGNLTLVDHALFRLDKGCVGFLMVSGDPQPQIYGSNEAPTPCYGCKVHV